MPSELILLTAANFGSHLTAYFQHENPELRIHVCERRDQLEKLFRGPARPGCRLIGFTTEVIVPPPILEAVPMGAYNFHPGPPNRPGLYPESFAAFDGDTVFGATVHEMVPRVDEGPIVGVSRFEVPVGATRMTYAETALTHCVSLLKALGPHLARIDDPLPRDPNEHWSGTKSNRRQFDALATVTPDMDADGVERRWRAFGAGPVSHLTMVLHGRRFHMIGDGQQVPPPPKQATVARPASDPASGAPAGATAGAATPTG